MAQGMPSSSQRKRQSASLCQADGATAPADAGSAKESVEKLGVLAQTTMDLRQRSEDVQGAAQQLTSALRSPNVKGRWGEVNLRRILSAVG